MLAAARELIEGLVEIRKLQKRTWRHQIQERVGQLSDKLAGVSPYDRALQLYALSHQIGEHRQKNAREDVAALLGVLQRELVHASDRARHVSVWFGGTTRSDLERALMFQKKADQLVDVMVRKIDDRLGVRLETALEKLGDRLVGRRDEDGTQGRDGSAVGQPAKRRRASATGSRTSRQTGVPGTVSGRESDVPSDTGTHT